MGKKIIALMVVLVAAGITFVSFQRMAGPDLASEAGGEVEIPESLDAGIALGEMAPLDLPLQDSAGEPTNLGEQMGEAGLVLMLNRSPDWCSYCRAQMMGTKDIAAAVEARGFGLAALTYDEVQTLAEFRDEEDVNYTLLSDRGSVMIDQLGLRDPQYREGTRAYGVPRATVLVLSPEGSVLAKNVTPDYRERPTNLQVLAIIDGS